MNSPLEQFKIKPIIRINPQVWGGREEWIDLTISNSTVYTIIVVTIIIGMLVINKKGEKRE